MDAGRHREGCRAREAVHTSVLYALVYCSASTRLVHCTIRQLEGCSALPVLAGEAAAGGDASHKCAVRCSVAVMEASR